MPRTAFSAPPTPTSARRSHSRRSSLARCRRAAKVRQRSSNVEPNANPKPARTDDEPYAEATRYREVALSRIDAARSHRSTYRVLMVCEHPPGLEEASEQLKHQVASEIGS